MDELNAAAALAWLSGAAMVALGVAAGNALTAAGRALWDLVVESWQEMWR